MKGAVATINAHAKNDRQIIEAVGGFRQSKMWMPANTPGLALVDDKKVNEKRLKSWGLRV